MESMTPGRWISLIIAALCIIIAVMAAGLKGLLLMCMTLLLPMACIWFGDELGDLIGIGGFLSGGVSVTQSTPGVFVRFVGWLVLLVFFSIFVIWPIFRKMANFN
jgi:hypothetical protein